MDIDALIIGEFEMLKSRDLDAVYEDGAIYLTNDQESVDDMFDDVVHEVAHSVEKNFGMDIFGDGQVETEFINKRRVLYSVLNAHGIRNLTMYDYLNPDYNKKFDKLYTVKCLGNVIEGQIITYLNVSIDEMKKIAPTILDVTHSLQKPNQKEGVTGGDPMKIETLARAGISIGVDGLFIETHPDPINAKSDGLNMLNINLIENLLKKLTKIRSTINSFN